MNSQYSNPRLLQVIVGLSLAALLAEKALAQQLGFSELQSDTSTGVATTCRGFVANGANNSLEQQLFDVCRSMVANERDLTSGSSSGRSRGLNATELGSGYQNIATEETLSPIRIGTNATVGQALTIISRTQQLRGGIASNFNPFMNGQYASNLNSRATGGSAGDMPDYIAGKLSGFVTPFGGFGDTTTTASTNGSDFNNIGFTGGMDYRITENLIFGLAGGYSHLDLDFNQNINVSGGGVNADIGAFSAYGTFYEGDFYVDTLFNYGWASYDIDRRVVVASNNTTVAGSAPINATAKGKTDGTQWTFSLQSGYDFHTDALSYGPYVKVNYTNVHTDPYTETGAGGLNLLVHQQNAESVQTVVGGQVSYAFSQSFGVILPYLRFDWVHEFANSSQTLAAQYVNDPRNNLLIAFSDSPDRNFFNLNTGVSTVFQGGIQAFFNYNTILDNDLISGHLFSVGARLEFQ